MSSLPDEKDMSNILIFRFLNSIGAAVYVNVGSKYTDITIKKFEVALKTCRHNK